MALINAHVGGYEYFVTFDGERRSADFLRNYPESWGLGVIPTWVRLSYTWGYRPATWHAEMSGRCLPGQRQKTAIIRLFEATEDLPQWFLDTVEDQAPPEWKTARETEKENDHG